jgi:hypothetical protein
MAIGCQILGFSAMMMRGGRFVGTRPLERTFDFYMWQRCVTPSDHPVFRRVLNRARLRANP